MNKSMILGVAAGVVAAAAAGALATRGQLGFGPRYAEVVSVTPLTKSVQTPRQECHQVQVTRQKPPQDQHRIAGTAIGAVVGGLLGSRIGGGSGKALATTAGVVGGGYAGNRIQDQMQKGDTETVTRQQCATVYDSSEIPDGYQVTYKLDGKTQDIHLDHDPGKQIPLKDGKLDLDAAGHSASTQAN